MNPHKEQTLTLYFDGSCPFCLAEMRLLEHKDQKGLLRFEDITAKNFSEDQHGVVCELAMKSIKGRLSSGEYLDGIEVFAKAYELVGLRTYAKCLSAKRLQAPLAWCYLKFAQHRHRLSKIFGPVALKLVNAYVGKKGT